MVKSIAIYVEGGGDTAQTLAPFRTGMSAFLKPVVDVVRQKGILWRVIPCGGRKQAYDAFVDALQKEPEVFNVLLVDSEDPIAITVSPWKHLLNRKDDGWTQPPGTDDTRCQMMVACMEAWFLADPAGLKKHYGDNLNEKALPPASQAETRSKDDINDALEKATKPTPAREYKKIRDGAKLLAKVDPAEVRKHCKWCERLFQSLGKAIGATI
jgi:hypothetical protein